MRFRLRFSLSTLLVFIVLISLACHFVGKIVTGLNVEQRASDVVDELGGVGDLRDTSWGARLRAMGISIPRKLTSIQFYGRNWKGHPSKPEHADFDEMWPITSDLDDRGLERLFGALGSLSDPPALTFNGTAITDKGLSQIAAVKRLKQLYVSGTKITDACLPSLAELTQLESVDVSATAVTDQGIDQLRALHHLKELDLTDTKVTTAEIVRLKAAIPALEIQQ